jgi:hypothetical protein
MSSPSEVHRFARTGDRYSRWLLRRAELMCRTDAVVSNQHIFFKRAVKFLATIPSLRTFADIINWYKSNLYALPPDVALVEEAFEECTQKCQEFCRLAGSASDIVQSRKASKGFHRALIDFEDEIMYHAEALQVWKSLTHYKLSAYEPIPGNPC